MCAAWEMFMKNPVPVLAALSLALAVQAAFAQTAAQGTVQQRARVIPRAAPATAPAVSHAAITELQTKPYAAAASKQTIPANLFSAEDRAIIIVSGRPVAAGDMKRGLLTELRQQSVPASAILRRAAAVAPAATPVRDLPGNFRPGVAANDRITATRHSAVYGAGRESVVAKPAQSYSDLINYCKTHPAEIVRVRGTVTPNGRFKIEGSCFGEQTGAVEAIGQFPGGHMRLVFESWSDSEITAFVPPVSGATDHSISLTVVRLDKARSPAVQARFVATREVVAVPTRFWSPTNVFTGIEVDQGGGDIFSSFRVLSAGVEARATPFSLVVNPACNLESASWSSSVGRVDAFNGWEAGPPNAANVQVVWTPRCVTQTTNYIVSSSSQRICSVEFQLSAWASCPVGVAP